MKIKKGFTLIELIIAMALMSLISLLLFASFDVGIKSWNAVEKQADKMAEQRLVWRFLTQSLSAVEPIKIRYNQRQHLLFSGTHNAIEFVAPVAKKAGIGGLSIVRIGLIQNKLVVNRWLYHPEIIEGKGSERQWSLLKEDPQVMYQAGVKGAEYGEHILATEIDTLEFEYLFKKEEWQTEWDKNYLPLLVKIKIKKQEEEWETLFIRLPFSSASRNPFSLGLTGRD